MRDGHLGLPDYERAAHYFREANHSQALCDLASLYGRGKVGLLKNGRLDYQTAIKLYCTSNTFCAYANIGNIYISGEWDLKESKPDYKKAFVYYGLCESILSKSSPIYEIEQDMQQVKMPLEMLYRKLTIVQNHYSEVTQFFPLLTEQQAITQLCDKTRIELSSLDASDREFYFGILAFYKERNYNQALIYFNNALILGDERALFHIKVIEAINSWEEEEAKRSLHPEENKESAKEDFATSEAIQDTHQHKTQLILDKKEENASEDRDSSVESSLSEKQLPLLSPLLLMSTLATKGINKQENPGVERPKQYKPKPLLTYTERKIKLLAKINKINKKIISSFESIIVMGDDAKIILAPLKVNFVNDLVQDEYQILPGKIKELMDCIEEKPYGTEGTGKPEVLKGKFKGHKGCISRRIDEENRLVYKVTGVREILILSCNGHYK